MRMVTRMMMMMMVMMMMVTYMSQTQYRWESWVMMMATENDVLCFWRIVGETQ